MNCINDVVIIRYGEIALKGKYVRNRYEKTLILNIKSMLDTCGIKYEDIIRDWGRIYVKTADLRAIEAVVKVFGVVSASPAVTCEPTLESTAAVSAEIGRDLIKDHESFAIRPRRSGKHSFSSQEIGVACGNAVFEHIKDKYPRVDLTSPDKEIFIEIRQNYGFVFTDIVYGIGGLPLGTQGRMVALVSGGIDSPVAAWLMMKRGCEIIPVFINNQPYSDEASRRKAMECIKVLQSWAPGRPLTVYEIPDGESLSAFLSNCESRYTCLLCRRMMYRIAHGIMNKENACGIITGSSLGQVASQTAQNMMVETSGIHIPIYHPLIGFDKTEIVDIARNIGTYEPSILPETDCKAVPEKPSTSAKISRIYHEEEKIDIQELLKHALSDVRMVNF